MNFSDAPPFHNLGNIVAIGITAAFCYSILFLPALVSVLPFGLRVRRYPRQFSVFDSFAGVLVRYKTTIIVASACLVAALALGATQKTAEVVE